MHLSWLIIAYKLERHFDIYALLHIIDTALHACKDFAVSPRALQHRLIHIILSRLRQNFLQTLATYSYVDALHFRSARLCSHLVDYPGGRYPLQLLLFTLCRFNCLFLYKAHQIRVRTFLCYRYCCA